MAQDMKKVSGGHTGKTAHEKTREQKLREGSGIIQRMVRLPVPGSK